MILTLTGASGVGKTTIASELLKKFPIDVRIVPSHTTRKPRDTDLPGEYRYVTKFRFWLMNLLGTFLWTVYPHGNSYGTVKRLVLKALRNGDKVHIMLLVPSAIYILNDFVEKTDFVNDVYYFIFYLQARKY